MMGMRLAFFWRRKPDEFVLKLLGANALHSMQRLNQLHLSPDYSTVCYFVSKSVLDH